MILRMLIENKCNAAGFTKEHGISLLIEFQGRKLLLDTGDSGAFVDNAIKMGLDVRDVDIVVISHAHSDHSGGLSRFLGINSHAPVYLSDRANGEYFVSLLLHKENVSAPGSVFQDYPDRIRFINGFTQVDETISLVMGFQRKYPISKSNRKLLVKENGVFVQDSFDHEMALVINNGGKLVILTGCSHNGADNMLDAVAAKFPGVPIQAVIGGFHLIGFPFPRLMGESRDYIEALGRRLLGYGIEKAYTCHCSGDWGYRVLKDVMGDRIEYFHTGMQVEL